MTVENCKLKVESLLKANKRLSEYANKQFNKAGTCEYSPKSHLIRLIRLLAYLPIRLQKAFTLAEVLITLGIIGVVAALTIPTLIQNHRRHVVETRLEKFYSSINQAIALAENEFGERENWEIRNTELTGYEWFNKYLKKYIKTVKIENVSNIAIVYLPDGSLFEFAAGGVDFFPNAKDYEYCKENSCMGTKRFPFYYAPSLNKKSAERMYITNLVEPYKYGWNGQDSHLYTRSNYGCKTPRTGNLGAYCTAVIQRNGWKIPDNYPFKF